MNSETQRDSSVILRLTRDLQPENLRPLQVGEVQFAISGDYIPVMVDNIININPKRFIFMASVGIYNELEGKGAEFNVDNDQSQIPNQYAAELIESSDVDYTIIRAGYLEHGEEDDYVISKNGETPAGYRTSMESVQKIALEIIEEPGKYSRESISVTKDMRKKN